MNEKKLKLLFVNGHVGVGGVEKSLVDVLKTINYEKYEVDLLLFEDYGEYFSQIPQSVHVIFYDLQKSFGSFGEIIKRALRKGDFKTIVLKIIFTLRSRFGVKYTKLLKMLHISDAEYDCAIAYRFGICADYVAYAVKAKKKYMWWHHGDFEFDEKTIQDWRETSINVNKIVCVSNAVKEMIAPYFPEKREDILVIPNMIIPEDIQKKATEFLPYSKERKQILVSVGRLSKEKHMVNAVYAMERLVNKGYLDLVWYLVGDGAERKEIEQAILDKKLEGKVICVGSKANPYPYIYHADLFVHPSYVESQSITVLEAFALKKRSVVTTSAGARELVRDKKNALMAEQSVESLVEQIVYALENKELSQEYEKYQEETVKKYCPEQIMDKINNLV